MQDTLPTARPNPLPAWVPQAVAQYLAHTERGCSIRELARKHAFHPSTILRQVRRYEARRDDPLIDAALTALSLAAHGHQKARTKETNDMTFVQRKGGLHRKAYQRSVLIRRRSGFCCAKANLAPFLRSRARWKQRWLCGLLLMGRNCGRPLSSAKSRRQWR